MINSEIIDENELFEKLYGDLGSVWVDEIGTVYSGGNLLYTGIRTMSGIMTHPCLRILLVETRVYITGIYNVYQGQCIK